MANQNDAATSGGTSKPRAPKAHPPTPNRELLSVRDAAAILGIGESLAWKLIHDGKLTRVSLGARTTRVRVKEVMEMSRGER